MSGERVALVAAPPSVSSSSRLLKKPTPRALTLMLPFSLPLPLRCSRAASVDSATATATYGDLNVNESGNGHLNSASTAMATFLSGPPRRAHRALAVRCLPV